MPISGTGVQNYDVAVKQTTDGELSKSRYSATMNDGRWYNPRVNAETGKPLGDEVLIIKVDDLMHYRLGRDKNGKATSLMMRKMSEERKSYTATILNTNSEVALVRIFDRQ